MKAKRILTALLAAGTAVSILASCGGGNTGSTSSSSPAETSTQANTSGETAEVSTAEGETVTQLTEIPLPIVEEKVTLTYWFPWDATVSNVVTNNNEVMSVQKMEEITNVHIDYIHPTIGQEKELFSVLLSSGDLPDMMYLSNGVEYPGGIVTGISDGMFLNINELVNQYAPNFSKWRQYDEVHQKETISDDGLILGFPMMNDIPEGANLGMCVRQDYLDKLGMEAPHTLDEVHEVLSAAKNELGLASPLLLTSNGVFMDSALLSAYGVGREWYQNDGTVLFGPMQNGYREYLEMMNQWYSEGLIDPNFVSNAFTGAPTNDLLVSDDVMMTETYWGRVVDAMVVNGVTQNQDFWLTPISAPVKNDGDTVGIRMYNSPIMSQTVLTKDCSDPVVAAMWLDYQYTEDAMILNNYGVEGETFYYDENGDFQFTDLIMNNPDGRTTTDANRLYIRRNGSGWIKWERQQLTNPTVKHKDEIWAYDVWSADGTEWVVPAITMTTEESSEFQSIYADIKTYVEESTVGMIMGTTPVDQFDAFVEQLKAMGIERAIEIEQAALDRYNAR